MPVVQRIERRVADPEVESSILSGHTQGGLAEWQGASFENSWAQALTGSNPVPSATLSVVLSR